MVAFRHGKPKIARTTNSTPHLCCFNPSKSDFEVLQFAEEEEGDQRLGGPAWLDGTPQDDEVIFFDHENKDSNVNFDGRSVGVIKQQQQQQRPRSKADLRREDLVSAAVHATT